MGLLIILDWFSEGNAVRQSLVLWILLAGAVGLTVWECRERGYRVHILLWWVSIVAITHVLGYIILRFFVRPPGKA